jgi:hypothetical protein
MPEAEAFQDFLFDKVIPSILNTGSFTLQKKVIPDTSFIKSFYDENNISDFYKLNVVYLGVIGLYDGGF